MKQRNDAYSFNAVPLSQNSPVVKEMIYYCLISICYYFSDQYTEDSTADLPGCRHVFRHIWHKTCISTMYMDQEKTGKAYEYRKLV